MNTVTAVFTGGTFAVASGEIYQWDYGQILLIEGLELPSNFEVHFADTLDGEATTAIGTSESGITSVMIPDVYLTSGRDVYAYIFLHTGAEDGETVYKIQIPVKQRPQPSGELPPEVERDELSPEDAAANASAIQAVDADNVSTITATFTCGTFTATSDEVYQWDYGQVLLISGLELPDSVEVHFTDKLDGTTTTQIGVTENGITRVFVPDIYLTSGRDVYAYLFLHVGTDDGETVYHIRIPVKSRPQPTGATPTPPQRDEISQAIAAANAAAAKAANAAAAAEDFSTHFPIIGDNEHWWFWDGTEYIDSGYVAYGRLVDLNSGREIRVWIGTLAEYNALPVIEPYVEYKILENSV